MEGEQQFDPPTKHTPLKMTCAQIPGWMDPLEAVSGLSRTYVDVQ